MKRFNTEAYFEGEDYNQDSWVNEKITNVLRDICCLIDNVDKQSENWEHLMSALSDCLKLYSFWSGDKSLYCKEVINFLAHQGLNGFLHLEYVSGNSSKKDLFTLQLEDNKIMKEIFELITPLNNRTEIYSRLGKLHQKNKWCKKIEDDLELVSFGEKKWDWFYELHKNDDMNNVVVAIATLIKNG